MTRLYLLLALIVISLSSCSMWDLEPIGELVGEPGDEALPIMLVNETGAPFFYDAWQLEASHLVDPRPTFTIEAVPFQKVHEDASVVLDDIHAYQEGDDIRIFLYTLDDHVETASPIVRLTRFVTITHEQLVASDGRIVVDPPR